MKLILASGLVNQNGHYYAAHLCDDGLVYINWDGNAFVSSETYEMSNPRTESVFGNQRLDIYQEAAQILKGSLQG